MNRSAGAGSESPEASQTERASRNGRGPFGRPAVRRTAVAICLTAVALVAVLHARHADRENKITWHSLQLAGANTLLTAQQLDALFAETLKHIPQDGNIGPPDNLLLGKWLQADEQFLADNADNGETRFERGIAHRRVGQCRYLQADYRHAMEHYRQSIELFESLSHDHPTVPSYVGEQVDTYIRLGWAHRLTGNLSGSDAAFRRAAELIRDERVTKDPSYAPHVSYHPLVVEVYLLDNQVARAMQSGANDKVLSFLQRIVAIFRQLNDDYPEHNRYQGSLAEAEAKLEAARRQFKQPHSQANGY